MNISRLTDLFAIPDRNVQRVNCFNVIKVFTYRMWNQIQVMPIGPKVRLPYFVSEY